MLGSLPSLAPAQTLPPCAFCIQHSVDSILYSVFRVLRVVFCILWRRVCVCLWGRLYRFRLILKSLRGCGISVYSIQNTITMWYKYNNGVSSLPHSSETLENAYHAAQAETLTLVPNFYLRRFPYKSIT